MLKTVSSIVNAIGAVNYAGVWNANTNTPALASGVGTKGDYYVVGVGGNTTLDGISNWGVGDWAVFNGTTWQRLEGGTEGNFVTLSVSGLSNLASVIATLLDVDNIRIDANRISSTNTNGNVEVIPNGSGQVLLNTTVSKDETTVANGFAMIGGGASTEVYAGTDTRTYATSYTFGGGTITLCNVQSRTGANVSGPVLRITTAYTYRGGSPAANYGIYVVTTGAGLAANLVSGVGTYPTITTTQIGSGGTGTADIIGNFAGDAHALFVVEVFGSVNSWGI